MNGGTLRPVLLLVLFFERVFPWHDTIWTNIICFHFTGIFWTILYIQICGNSLEKAIFYSAEEISPRHAFWFGLREPNTFVHMVSALSCRRLIWIYSHAGSLYKPRELHLASVKAVLFFLFWRVARCRSPTAFVRATRRRRCGASSAWATPSCSVPLSLSWGACSSWPQRSSFWMTERRLRISKWLSAMLEYGKHFRLWWCWNPLWAFYTRFRTNSWSLFKWKLAFYFYFTNQHNSWHENYVADEERTVPMWVRLKF